MADTVAETQCRRLWLHIPDLVLLAPLIEASGSVLEDIHIVKARHEGDRMELLLESKALPLVLAGDVVPVVDEAALTGAIKEEDPEE